MDTSRNFGQMLMAMNENRYEDALEFAGRVREDIRDGRTPEGMSRNWARRRAGAIAAVCHKVLAAKRRAVRERAREALWAHGSHRA